jgi:hypothetical protein
MLMTDLSEFKTRLRGFDLARAAKNPLSSGFIQWCVVTPDLDQTCEKLESLYGVPGFYILEPGPLRNVKFRGEPIDLRVDMALGYIGQTNVEVIRPDPHGPDNIYTEFLEQNPQGGFHHLGFRVHDFEAASGQLAADFGAIEQEGSFGTEGTRFAYFDTRSSTGLYTEILWFDTGAELLMDAVMRGDEAALRG